MADDLVKIEDHVEEGVGHLTSVFKDKEKIKKLATVFLERTQELEDVIYDLYSKRDLNNATGYQLDGLGKIVGIERGGRDDEDYRNLIIAKIGQNTSKGFPENLITVFNLITKSDRSHLLENFIAECEIYGDNDFSDMNIEDIYKFCQQVVPAGVKLSHVGSFDSEEPFGFDGDPDAEGFGDLYDSEAGGKFSDIIV